MLDLQYWIIANDSVNLQKIGQLSVLNSMEFYDMISFISFWN